MCIAILNASGILSKKTFKNSWNSNPDGAGLTYFDGKNIQLHKEMKSWRNFYDAYLNVRNQYPDIYIAVHFRIATHGSINIVNCHPFKVNKKTAFIHNGMINAMPRTIEHSDTYLFNETILKKLPANFIYSEAITELLSEYIGHSKLVIISGNDYTIINEHLGHWNAGNWYSNESYKGYKKPLFNVCSIPSKKSQSPDKYDNYIYDWEINDFMASKNKKNDADEDIHDTFYTSGNDVIKSNIKTECECCNENEATIYSRDYYIMICEKCKNQYQL